MLPDIFSVSFESIRLRFLRKAITSGGETPPLQLLRECFFYFECISLKNMRLFHYNQSPLVEALSFSEILFRCPFSSPVPLSHKSAEKTSSLPISCAFNFSAWNNREIGQALFLLRGAFENLRPSPQLKLRTISDTAVLQKLFTSKRRYGILLTKRRQECGIGELG